MIIVRMETQNHTVSIPVTADSRSLFAEQAIRGKNTMGERISLFDKTEIPCVNTAASSKGGNEPVIQRNRHRIRGYSQKCKKGKTDRERERSKKHDYKSFRMYMINYGDETALQKTREMEKRPEVPLCAVKI